MKDGLNTFCIICHKTDNVARKAINRKDPSFLAKEHAQRKIYREKNREKLALNMIKWREENAEAIAHYNARIEREGLPLAKYRTF